MNNKTTILAIFLLIFVTLNNHMANATSFLTAPTDCAGLAAIHPNQIYKYDPVGMKQLLRLGCPPPKAWRKAVNHKLAAGGEMSGFSAAARVPAHEGSRGYKAKGACSNFNITKAGGLSDLGSFIPCVSGFGFGFFNIKIPILNIPEINLNQLNCMGNLVEQVTNGNASDVDVDLNLSGSCAVGTVKNAAIGQCGLDSTSGKVCTTNNGSGETASNNFGSIDKPFSRVTAPKYIPISDVTAMKYINNSLNRMTAIYLPNGGTVQTQYGTYTLEPSMFVTMNADGEVFMGPDISWVDYYDNEYYTYCTPTGTMNRCCYEQNYSTNCRIDLANAPIDEEAPVGSYVTITPNQQVVNVDSAIFEGDTLNQTTQYTRYTPTNVIDNNDGREAPVANPDGSANPYDPRVNTTEQNTQTGPGPQNCLSAPIANLAGLPPADDYCVGSQQVGLADSVINANGEPTLQCPPSVSLFCVEQTNSVNNSAPAAAQQ
jgi:hypothetical protein